MSITLRYDCNHCQNLAEVDARTLADCELLLRGMGWSVWNADVRCPACYQKWAHGDGNVTLVPMPDPEEAGP